MTLIANTQALPRRRTSPDGFAANALTLRTMQDGAPVDYRVGPGDVFLLPPGVPHSPQRPAGSVGLVVERRRLAGELDRFQWYCPSCHGLLHEEPLTLEDIETQFPPVFARFAANLPARTCRACGTVLDVPAPTT